MGELDLTGTHPPPPTAYAAFISGVASAGSAAIPAP
jgi:hypothetical protein